MPLFPLQGGVQKKKASPGGGKKKGGGGGGAEPPSRSAQGGRMFYVLKRKARCAALAGVAGWDPGLSAALPWTQVPPADSPRPSPTLPPKSPYTLHLLQPEQLTAEEMERAPGSTVAVTGLHQAQNQAVIKTMQARARAACATGRVCRSGMCRQPASQQAALGKPGAGGCVKRVDLRHLVHPPTRHPLRAALHSTPPQEGDEVALYQSPPADKQEAKVGVGRWGTYATGPGGLQAQSRSAVGWVGGWVDWGGVGG